MKKLSVSMILVIVIFSLFFFIDLKKNLNITAPLIEDDKSELPLKKDDSLIYEPNKNLTIDTSTHQVSPSK